MNATSTKEMGNMEAKAVSFIVMMGVLGNILFAISYYTGVLAPGVNLDFSLAAVLVAGFYGGPFAGLVSGFFAGIFPAIMFGPLGMGSWLGLIGLPLGKGLTGLTAGVISGGLNLAGRNHSSILSVPTALISYIPECLFTYYYFAYLMPLVLGIEGGSFVFVTLILPKALAEVTIISFLMAAVTGNKGFNDFISRFFARSPAFQSWGRTGGSNQS
jgi:hypothetical protein